MRKIWTVGFIAAIGLGLAWWVWPSPNAAEAPNESNAPEETQETNQPPPSPLQMIEAASYTAAGCMPRTFPEPKTEEERLRQQRYLYYFERMQAYAQLLSTTPDAKILMPVRGIGVKQVADTYGAPRSGGRKHEGQDIFARKGTPIYSATSGYVWRMGYGELGGLYVYVMGPGGRRYYYAHLDSFAKGLAEGDKVTPQTILGTVGNTGNARTTPPHLHFGVYEGPCRFRAINPLPLMADRNWKTLGAAASSAVN